MSYMKLFCASYEFGAGWWSKQLFCQKEMKNSDTRANRPSPNWNSAILLWISLVNCRVSRELPRGFSLEIKQRSNYFQPQLRRYSWPRNRSVHSKNKLFFDLCNRKANMGLLRPGWPNDFVKKKSTKSFFVKIIHSFNDGKSSVNVWDFSILSKK
jgi:hypothetical protein